MSTDNPDWWREYVVSVPRPIPRGYCVGMRDEVRDGKPYVVEFLEKVPEYQPNPFAVKAKDAEPAERTEDGLSVSTSRGMDRLFCPSRE